MGDKLLQHINMPIWSLLLSIFIICSSFIINTKVFSAKTEVRIEQIEEKQNNMLDVKDLHYIVLQLDEIKKQNCNIEKKLDEHIAK